MLRRRQQKCENVREKSKTPTRTKKDVNAQGIFPHLSCDRHVAVVIGLQPYSRYLPLIGQWRVPYNQHELNKWYLDPLMLRFAGKPFPAGRCSPYGTLIGESLRNPCCPACPFEKSK